jgi:hypothetical protein
VLLAGRTSPAWLFQLPGDVVADVPFLKRVMDAARERVFSRCGRDVVDQAALRCLREGVRAALVCGVISSCLVIGQAKPVGPSGSPATWSRMCRSCTSDR